MQPCLSPSLSITHILEPRCSKRSGNRMSFSFSFGESVRAPLPVWAKQTKGMHSSPPPPKSIRRDSSQTKPDIEKMKDTKKSCLGLYMCAFEKNSDFWPWQPHFWYFLCPKNMF